jgi:nickel/cobalt transporter (NiCoT) family protein
LEIRSSSKDKLTIFLLFLGIGIATLVAFLLSETLGKLSFELAGLGLVAYVFGLRHGVDADHIAAIDNTTRKLMQEGKRPLSVGTWFSLGHSTIVIALIVVLVISTRAIMGAVPGLESVGTILGTVISGSFLWLIGLINVTILLGIYRVFKQMKQGTLDPARLEKLLEERGFFYRYFGRFFKVINKPWQLYPVGVLFGLGFDTASEVALIAISVEVSLTQSVSIWIILVLPFMFTCGMVLVDTFDAVSMTIAYRWAFLKPLRKIYYNLTVTLISVLVAFVIGGIEVLQVLSSELNLNGLFWISLARLNFENLGYGILAIFLTCWLVSAGYYYARYKRLEDTIIPLLQ